MTDPESPRNPVEIVADRLASDDFISSCAAYQDDAWYLLNSLRQAGWRIVRTEVDEYDGEDVQILMEWTP